MASEPPAAQDPPLDTRTLPAVIGRYRILRVLGQGGMGTVYEAEQERPRRTVALKVVQSRFVSAETLRRFEHEFQSLGRLQHPGIAQIYEPASDYSFGPQPYFAMELVRGPSLTEYVETRRLNAGERLELIAKICDAVQHAHQRGIIHRDLKPANILVDESGQPKILDLGVARATDQDRIVPDIDGAVGRNTCLYESGVLADPGEIDTRSDVYAIGVILFELLAGHLPYQIARQLDQVVRTIREEDPAPLGSLNRVYRGDIETIVGKALEKDKERRYQSAAELGGDIRRFFYR